MYKKNAVGKRLAVPGIDQDDGLQFVGWSTQNGCDTYNTKLFASIA
jgi:hypothetical protein